MTSEQAFPRNDAELWSTIRQEPGVLSRAAGDYQLSTDSVDLATGTFAGCHQDFRLPGTFALDIARYFRPHVAAHSTGGPHCAWIFDARLIIGPGLAVLIDHDGAAIEFDTTEALPTASRSGPFRILTQTPTGYQVMGEHYHLWHFTEATDSASSTSASSTMSPANTDAHGARIRTARLAAITSRTGQRIRFLRADDGRTQSVEHSAGISIVPGYDGSVVEALTIYGRGYDFELPLVADPFPTRPEAPRKPGRPDPSAPLTATFPDGSVERWWFDSAHTFRGWIGRTGQALRRQVNAHRQTLELEAVSESGAAQRLKVLRNQTSEPVVIHSNEGRWLIGYAYPGCIAQVRRDARRGGRPGDELGEAQWTNPDVPSMLRAGNHTLDLECSATGALQTVRGQFGTALIDSDTLGLPSAVTAGDGTQLRIDRDNFADTITFTAQDGRSRQFGMLNGSIAATPMRWESPPERRAPADPDHATAQRFFANRAHGVNVEGRCIRLNRNDDGHVQTAFIEGTAAVSGASPATTTLNLDFGPPAPAAPRVRHAVAAVADPDTGTIIALVDDTGEVSVRARFDDDAALDVGHNAEWIDTAGTPWTGTVPERQLIPADGPDFAAATAPGRFFAFCACPSLDPAVASDEMLRQWLAEVDRLVVAPGAAVNEVLAGLIGPTYPLVT